MEKIKICFIGAGGHANLVHYPSLNDMDDVEIVGICDLNEERLNKTAELYKIEKRFKNYIEMLEKLEVNGVYIIMGGEIIYSIVMHCLKQGLNVFIEKPPGITLHQIETLANMAVKKNCKTMVGFNRRFIPILRKTKKILEEKGPIIQCVGTFYKSFPTGEQYNFSPVDILTSDAIHCVDTLRWLGGEVKQVKSLVRKFYANVYNCFISMIEFENGGVGILLANWALATRIHTFEIHSKGISAFIDLPLDPSIKSVIYDLDRKDPIVLKGIDICKSDKLYRFYGYFDENRHFIDCIKENKDPETSFVDAVKTMELIYNIYKNSF